MYSCLQLKLANLEEKIVSPKRIIELFIASQLVRGSSYHCVGMEFSDDSLGD